MHVNVPMGIKLNLEHIHDVYITKFKYLFYKLSFVQLKQGHRIDLCIK